MPRYPITRSTNFIIEEESWNVIEYDHTSVPGTIYLSLTENKINTIYDDVENNIADLDKKAVYELLLPEKEQRFNIGDIIEPRYTLTKNGKVCNLPVKFISTDKSLARIIDGQLKACASGEVEIEVQLVDYPEIMQSLKVIIGEQPQEFSVYIKGNASIPLDRKSTYSLVTIDNEYTGEYLFVLYNLTTFSASERANLNEDEYEFFDHPKIPDMYLALHKNSEYIEGAQVKDCVNKFDVEKTLARVIKNGTDWIVQTNNKNKLGFVMLSCIYQDDQNTIQFTYKIIEIVPLW